MGLFLSFEVAVWLPFHLGGMKAHTEIGSDRPPEESPVAWFVMLERARMDGDFERAAHAQRELARLGVMVRYRTRRAPAKGGAK